MTSTGAMTLAYMRGELEIDSERKRRGGKYPKELYEDEEVYLNEQS